MNKNDKIQLQITDMGINGEGIGRFNDYAFFVKNAVIGDEVEAVITKLNKGYGFAKAVNIIKPSSCRVEPVCPNAARCGGCQIMQMDYKAQLKFKADKVKGNLERIGGQKDFIFRDIIGMEQDVPCGFRNKVQFPVGKDNEGKAVTGFYAGRTHYIIPTGSCPVSAPVADVILNVIREFIDENNISVYDEESGKGLVRHVLIRTGTFTGQILVCLVINGSAIPNDGEEKLINKLTTAVPEISGICLNINRKNTNVILGDKIRCIFGAENIEDKIKDLTFRISPLSFFQVNGIQTEKLYDKALEYAALTGNETVWDLYCGAGTISLFLAKKAKQVYGVEIVAPAIENAKINAKLNNIENARFFCGPSEAIFPEKVKEHMAESGAECVNGFADVVVVDPPRKGCDGALLESILQVEPSRIVYVSCDSATLARDVKILTDSGKYKLVEATPVDMFPHTVHVETVVCLSNKNAKPKDYVEIGLDAEDYYRIKDSKKD